MDYREYYKEFLAPCGTRIDPKVNPDLFFRKVIQITSVLEEIERIKLKQSVSQALQCKAKGKTSWVFLTVNFDPSKAFEECFKAGQKLGNRKIWEWAAWAHEQRGETPTTAGNGHHLHLVAKIAASNAKTRAKTTVCHVCQVSNSAIFHWKYIPEEYVADKLRYITEAKALEKQAKQEIDTTWRAANNISPVYYNGQTPKEEQQASPTTSL